MGDFKCEEFSLEDFDTNLQLGARDTWDQNFQLFEMSCGVNLSEAKLAKIQSWNIIQVTNSSETRWMVGQEKFDWPRRFLKFESVKNGNFFKKFV